MGEVTQKRKLYVFTDQYPWGKGEKPFIESELEALIELFDITIISMASDEAYDDKPNRSELPQGVEAIHWRWPPLPVFILHATGFFFSRVGWEEIKKLRGDGFSIGRVLNSVRAYGISKTLLAFYKKIGILNDPDALYYSIWFSYQLLALCFYRESHEFDLISRIHGYDLYNARNPYGRQPFQWFKKAMTDLIIFASSNAMAQFEEEFGPEDHPGQYKVNRLGVQRQDSLAMPMDGGAPKLIVSCSNVIPLKRVDMIARAIGQSPRKREIRWVHFGDGEMLGSVRALAKSYDIDAAFFGHVRNDKVVEFYRENDVAAAILLSQTEGGCPVCFQEALAFGIPLIGTDVGGVGEEIDGNGVLLDANPVLDDVVDAIEQVCFADRESALSMGRRSKEIWAERFDVKSNKRDFLDLIACEEWK